MIMNHSSNFYNSDYMDLEKQCHDKILLIRGKSFSKYPAPLLWDNKSPLDVSRIYPDVH
jgi:hypothetical protein